MLPGRGLVAVTFLAAAPAQEPIYLDYDAPSGCPDVGAFASELAQRNGSFRRATASERARTFEVAISRLPDGRFAGRLTVRDAMGKETAREMDGETCAEVASALALIAALAVDPAAADAIPARPAPAPAPAPEPPAPSPRAGEAPHVRLAVGAHGGVTVGASPRPVAIFPPFIELSRTSPSIYAPSLRIGLAFGWRGSIDVAGSSARFATTAATIDASLLRMERGPFSAYPALGLELGVLEAAGEGIIPARSETRPWAALGLTGQLQWLFTSMIFLEIRAGLRFPLVRDRFFFEPDRTVYEVPAVGGMVSGGLGVRIL